MHLKTYKIFELFRKNYDGTWEDISSQSNDGEIARQEISDVLLPLRDEGLPIKVMVSMDLDVNIFVGILDYQHKSMKWRDIKDEVERCVDVAKLLKFNPVNVWYKQVHLDGRIFNKGNRELANWDDFIEVIKDEQTLAFLSIQFEQDIENELFESKSEPTSKLKFTKQPKKKGAKTDTYNVSKGGYVIGQVKWSSRMRGYAFLPTQDCDAEIKEFVKELMRKRREEK